MLPVKSALLLLGALVLLVQGAKAVDLEEKEWYETTLVYQIWPRAFQDSDGNGEGDLQGIISRLDYFNDLGVETILLHPIYSSPLTDSGYDISDYVNINQLFGNLDDFDTLVAEAHSRGLKVVLVVVPNHSSDEHSWFTNSVNRVEPYTDYYIWHNGTVDQSGNNVAPNNWESLYGGEESAWTWNEIRQQWYFHQFHSKQPDLNLRNDVVVQDVLSVLEFWLARGVDGFQIDSAAYFYEDEDLTNNPADGSVLYNFGHEDNAELLYKIRAHVDEWLAANRNGSKVLLVAESTDTDENLSNYYGNNTHEGIAPLNYRFITSILSNTNASVIKDYIDSWVDLPSNNASTNWMLSNHNNQRVASRLGLNRADAHNMINLLMPGQAYTYYGDEIAMLDHTSIDSNETLDTLGCAQTEDTFTSCSRDPARTPMQWENSTSAGFSTSQTTFLPLNPNFLTRNVEAQLVADRSNVQTYKALAALRKQPTFTHGDYEIAALNTDRVLVLKRSLAGYPTYVVLANLGLSRQTVNLGELYSDLPEDLKISLLSNNAILTGETVSRDSILLTANAAVVVTDEEVEDSTTESSAASTTETGEEFTTIETTSVMTDSETTSATTVSDNENTSTMETQPVASSSSTAKATLAIILSLCFAWTSFVL